MSIRNPVYTVFMAGAVIAPNLIVKMGAADKTVIPGAAATDQPLGISVQNITAQIGDRVDVVVGGEYGTVSWHDNLRDRHRNRSCGRGRPVHGADRTGLASGLTRLNHHH
jgi:hypothetical protein